MAQIQFKNVSKIYHEGSTREVRALDNVSFSINEGEFVVILGPSGAGKSTLLNILGGMDRLTHGEFILSNQAINKLDDKALSLYRREKIGFVFQFYSLIPNLTALENVQIAETLSNNALESAKAMESVKLTARLNSFPNELSGGEQQRVAIARAIVKNPTLLLCDEPTGALDSKTGQVVIDLLHEISKKYHKTVIVVTHNETIAKKADKIIRVNDGKISK